jgi:hypothetical protein
MSAIFALSRAHGKNIDRNHRLLKTTLSDAERSYIEWRLSQERRSDCESAPAYRRRLHNPFQVAFPPTRKMVL